MRKIIVACLLIGSLLAAGTAWAQDPAKDASATTQGAKEFATSRDVVTAMAAKASTIKDFCVSLFYRGMMKNKLCSYIIDYRCVQPSDIRTRIVAGNYARTTLVYKPSDKPDSIHCKKGMFIVWKTIESLGLQNSPLVQSLLDQVLKEIQEYPEGTIKGTDKLTLSIGKNVSVVSQNGLVAMDSSAPVVTADAPTISDASPSPEASSGASPSPETSPAASPSATPEPSPSAAPEPSPSPAVAPTPEASPQAVKDDKDARKIEKECIIIEFKKDGVQDLLAIDKETLWVVYRKKLVNGNIDQEAVVWDIQENTSPKIDF
ncbi:MAG: hypothetical protein RDV48_14795 [Candidatus Eremiobacteraeota bacterium]|nr:hypothetical protein [Candidatus Eremiobacteraeota bacterium]